MLEMSRVEHVAKHGMRALSFEIGIAYLKDLLFCDTKVGIIRVAM
jgi:hypothetical protein